MLQILYKVGLRPTLAVRTHLICWSLFLFYEIGMSGTMLGRFQPFAYYLLFYLLNISLFYFYAIVILQRGLTNTMADIWRVPLFTFLALLVYILASAMITLILTLLSGQKPDLSFLHSVYVLVAVWRGVCFILYGTGYYFLIDYFQRKEKAVENEKLKNDLLRAEHDYLRAQINPHLLFNTLSFIKYAARKKPEEANEAMMRLSEIMGFALENNTITVPLSKELNQVENIIKLNQLRFNHTLNINYIIHIHDDNVPTIPIILLTLVENIFKHGNLLMKARPAEVYVESTSEYLFFRTENLPSENAGRITGKKGLLNIASRLNQLYRDKHEFTYGMDKGIFKAEIKIYYRNGLSISDAMHADRNTAS
jgi:two-component system LytT family sensor kinase